ncbi:Competence protein ComM [Nocardioides aquaticus]|uniref:Competence protein ComM n=1 Tax=Nocardioides aquaticus TaxID=160826 RepID=A0ABX8EIY1_9ACTN|nr:ATP-binding protein [Nocardioides aquaticus]QVT79028.1 Competence protein ComM [Nocardioides aquaticus]
MSIARRDEMVRLPARCMIVLACNPCPCGEYRVLARENRCTCSEVRRRDYRARVAGPVEDRIDVVRHVEPARLGAERDPMAVHESSATVRARVTGARQRQDRRFADDPWRLNAHAPATALNERWPLGADASRLVEDAVYAGRLTRRGAVRVHRLALTVADLAAPAGAADGPPGADDVAVALRLRSGQPLLVETLSRRAR